MKRRSVFAVAAGMMLAASVAFAQAPPAAPAPAAQAPAAAKPAAKKVLAKFVTSEGNFTAELFEADAPKTVANFIGLATGSKQIGRASCRERVS